jgi:DNA-binding IclR family transcriptional regulator
MAEHSLRQATSLVKALRVLLALAEQPEGCGVTELARTLGLPKSAVHRLLVTFTAHGFVHKQEQQHRYTLGPAVVRLGLRAADLFTPRVVARPYLEALAQEVGETVFLGVRVQEHVLVVEKVERGQVLRISPPLGTRLPLCHTALGKLLLAFSPTSQQEGLLDASLAAEGQSANRHLRTGIQQELATIVQQGFAVSLEEWAADICCLAAPIRNSLGEVVAALALALPRHRMPLPPRHDPFAMQHPARQYPTLVPALLSTAARISAALP